MSKIIIGDWDKWALNQLVSVRRNIESLAGCTAALDVDAGVSGYQYLEDDEERRIREYSDRVLRELESAAVSYANALRKRLILDNLIRERERETGSDCKGECPSDGSF